MNYDIIVIGGGPAGVISAITAKKYYKDKSILLIKSIGKGVIPCGIPYMFSTLDNPEKNAMSNASLEKNNITFAIDEVESINKDKQTIITKKTEYTFQKLIIATGSTPIVPPIKGIEKKGIYSIKKDLTHLSNLKKDIEKAQEIVIVGGGFIGVEFADELSQFKDKKVTLIELAPEILANSFDEEFSKLAKEELISKNVQLMTNKKLIAFNGEEYVQSVTLSDGSEIPCQLVILGIGAKPNTKIAKEAGLEIGQSQGIIVDEFQRTTTDNNIFAVGDCVEKKDFFTRKKIPVMLASTATAEARIAGSNLFTLKVVRENKGTIAIYSTKIGDVVLASAGLTEKTAIQEGFEISIGRAESSDKHPASLPDNHTMKVKLIFSKQSGILLGGQVAGGVSAGEIINVIGLALQKRVSSTELETLQIATHPKLTAAPTNYPLIIAAQDALINK